MSNQPTSTVTAAEAIRTVLRSNPEGLTARELASRATEQGPAYREVQQAIRRAIDEGVVGLGGNLELRIAERA